MPLPRPYLVTARTYDTRPVRLGVLAHGTAQAIHTMQALYPNHLITATPLQPEWRDYA